VLSANPISAIANGFTGEQEKPLALPQTQKMKSETAL